jgi:hypothetical protein
MAPFASITLVGFEVLTAVVTKGSVFWDVTPCIPLKVKVNDFQRTTRRYIPEDSTQLYTWLMEYKHSLIFRAGNRSPGASSSKL